jgi:hypothetical protein
MLAKSGLRKKLAAKTPFKIVGRIPTRPTEMNRRVDMINHISISMKHCQSEERLSRFRLIGRTAPGFVRSFSAWKTCVSEGASDPRRVDIRPNGRRNSSTAQVSAKQSLEKSKRAGLGLLRDYGRTFSCSIKRQRNVG